MDAQIQSPVMKIRLGVRPSTTVFLPWFLYPAKTTFPLGDPSVFWLGQGEVKKEGIAVQYR
jgi:hypothetical protein